VKANFVMKLRRRQFLHLAAGAAAVPAVSRIARAQSYPSRPITMIVPFAAGGTADVIGRIVAERMRVTLGQPVIIEAVSGAGGSVGVGRVARAAPDGYTLSFGIWNTHVVNGAIYPLAYDVLRDFAPIALLASAPDVIVAKNAMPANDLMGLIAWLKANPDKASWGTQGAGGPSHIGGVFFQNVTGTRFGFVPYRGIAPAMQDLVAGQIDILLPAPDVALPQVRAGKIKAFAITAKTRLPQAPDIPTVDEAGLPGFYISVWSALWAPKGTPKDIITKLNAGVVDAMADPAVRSRCCRGRRRTRSFRTSLCAGARRTGEIGGAAACSKYELALRIPTAAPANASAVAMITHINGIWPKMPAVPVATAVTVGKNKVRKNSACAMLWIVSACPVHSRVCINSDFFAMNRLPLGILP
jgi:tripartite-type tricarboxylate transporter receptor subunit TctC